MNFDNAVGDGFDFDTFADLEESSKKYYIEMLETEQLEECFTLVTMDKANMELSDGNGETLFHHACRKGEFRIIRLLIILGVDYKLKNSSGIPGDDIAYQNGHDKICDLISREKNMLQ
jgi:hypothetical protein